MERGCLSFLAKRANFNIRIYCSSFSLPSPPVLYLRRHCRSSRAQCRRSFLSKTTHTLFYAFFPLFARRVRFFFSVLCCYEKSWHHEIAGEIERSQRVRAKDRKKHPSLCIAYLFPTLFTLSFSSLSMMHSNFHQLFPNGIRSQPTEENSYSKLSLSNMAAHNFLRD